MNIPNRLRWFGPRALACAALLSVASSASALPFVFTGRDLVMVLRKDGGTFELAVDLGQASRFYSAAPGSRISFDEFTPAQISDAFDSLGALRWSIGGCARLGDGGDSTVPVATLWVTRSRSNPDEASVPFNRVGAGSQQQTAGKIQSIGLNAQSFSSLSAPPGPDNTRTVVRVPAGDRFAFSQFLGLGADYSGTFQDTVESVTPDDFDGTQRADLYEVRPGSGESKNLGYFEISSAGALAFVAAGGSVVIPRPVASIARADGVTHLSFATVSGATYRFRYTNAAGLSSSPATWQLSSVSVAGDGSVHTLDDDASGESARFYSIEATP